MAIENFSITAAVPIIILFLKLVLDTVGMFTVEKILLTNFRRITIYLAQILGLTVISQILLIPFQSRMQVDEQVVHPIIISMIAMAIVITVAFLCVGILGKILSIKISFYIVDKVTDEKWIIKRMVGNNKLLVSKNINSFKFIDLESMNDREIYRVYEKEKIIYGQEFISSHAKVVHFSLAVFLIITSIASLSVSGDSGSSEILLTIALMIEYLSVMYIFAAINNEKVMREVDGENIASSS